MKRAGWKKKIIQATKDAGTYKPFFDHVIDTLAGMLEMRDDAQETFEKTGGKTVVVHVNKAKEKNLVKNPALVAVLDLNAQALSYWRDLGLTPSGLKKINEAAMKERKTSALAEVLKDIGG